MTDLNTYLQTQHYVEKGKIYQYRTRVFLKDAGCIEALFKEIPEARTPQEALYLYINGLKKPKTCVCGNLLAFSGTQYTTKYCSTKCSNSSSEGKKAKQQGTLEKYGVTHYSKTDEYKRKFTQTMIDTYGVTNPNQLQSVKDKKKLTYNTTLGVDNPSQAQSVKNKKAQKTWETMVLKLSTTRLANLVTPDFKLSDYKGIDYKYPWICKKCGTHFTDHLKYGKIPTCPTCFSSSMGYSKLEKEVSQWIQSLGFTVQENVKHLINDTQEVDIWVPSKNLAIEVNGVYWHSELQGKDRYYHIGKLRDARLRGITLLQIWDAEWVHSKSKIQAILKSYLGITTRRLFARKCTVVSISKQEANEFFDTYHLQNGCNASTVHIALQYDKEIVAVMSFGKPRFSTKYEWELLRAATKDGVQIIGGVSKLISYFTKDHASLLSYCDARLFTGRGYEAAGMIKFKESSPNYFYMKTSAYTTLLPRETFQKHKLASILSVFDPKLTEWENMQLNGYDRIWDCGTYVYTWSKS